MKNDIYVLIVENGELAKSLIGEHLHRGGITYANMLPASKREDVTRKLDELDAPQP